MLLVTQAVTSNPCRLRKCLLRSETHPYLTPGTIAHARMLNKPLPVATSLLQAVPPNLDKQVDFLQTALAESDADWTIVVNHHPIMGAADTGYGLTSADQPDQGTQDPGNLLSAKYNNQNVWSKVRAGQSLLHFS